LRVIRGRINFDEITYHYSDDPGGEPLFKEFSLAIEPGERIGLVGPSGSGKTTLTKLLLRFADVDTGAITIDGQNIAHVSQESLRKHIAYVPQEPMLFHRSIRDNIAYARPHVSDEEVEQAARQANALEFIERLPEGFHTTVGERGVKLSGGQRQRIAIARAILKNAPILVFDEATSALDSESEKYIQAALSNLMQGRTSIVVAHRLSTIAALDRIVVLDNGGIREQGTHKDLLKQKGIYATLWAHQSGGFIET
jgi:ATP-binding cassette subfamily B protein